MKQKRLEIITFTSILILVFTVMCTTNIFDTDVYYLIAQGRDIIENGFPDKTIQNWLYCVIMAFLYDNFDIYGLIIFMIAQCNLFVVLLYKFLRLPYKMFVFILIPIVLAFSYWSLRPEIITFILLLGTAICIEKGGKWQWLIPILVLLEINLHASYWIFHFIIMIPYVFPNVFKLKDIKKKIKILPLITSFGVLFINPYTYKNVLYLFNALTTNTDNFKVVTELANPTLDNIYTWVYIAGIVLCTILIVKKQISSTALYMFIGLCIPFVLNVKNISIYVFGLIYLFRELKPIEIPFPKWINYVCIPICLLFILSIIDNANFDIYKYKNSEDLYNLTAKMEKSGKVLSPFEQNNYFEFMGYDVYYDARPELYPDIDLQLILTYKPSNREEYAQYINNTFDYDYIVTNDKNLRLLEYAQDNCELLDKQTEYYLFKRKT